MIHTGSLVTDAAKLTNVRIARFRECRDLVRECELFVEL